MPYLLQYLIKFSISLAVLYLFYLLVLRPLTFYQWNRFYLLGYSLLAFFIPFINIDAWLNKPALLGNGIIKIIPRLVNDSNGAIAAAQQTGSIFTFNVYDWILVGFCLGLIMMLTRTILQLLSLRRIQKNARLLNKEGAVHFYETIAPVSPFSFGNSIYFNSSLHPQQELESIIRHEYVHVKQKHSLDLMLGEIVCILNWYNPFAWLIRFSIRQNLEFIADSKVLANGLDKKEYQYLLLKVLGLPQYKIANHFNISNLKKRIIMMNKLKTARLQLARFLFVLPLLAILLLAFRGRVGNLGKHQDHGESDSTPVKLLNAAQIQKEIDEIGKFMDRNPQVQLFYTTENKKTQFVFLKNGTLEKYGEGAAKSIAAMEHKYGTLPSTFVQPVSEHPSYENEWKDIATAAERIFNTANKKVRQIVFPGDSRVLVQLLNNKVEIYDMDNTGERTNFETQYGKLPAVVPLPYSISDTVPLPPIPPVPAANISNAPKPEAAEKTAPAPPPFAPANLTIPGKNTGLIQSMEITSDTNHAKKSNIKIIQITLKDGSKEIYNLGNPKEKAAFTNKYGPLADTPLPPTAPLPPNHSSQIKLSASKIQLNSLQQSNILIILNGVAQPLGTNLNTINPEDIESVDVLKNESAMATYGEKGKNGVIKIKTKNGVVTPYNAAHTDTLTVVADSISLKDSHMQIANARITINGNEAILTGDLGFFDFQNNMPLVFYNGKEVTEPKTFKLENTSVKILSLSPAAAIGKYGERAKYGALSITPN